MTSLNFIRMKFGSWLLLLSSDFRIYVNIYVNMKFPDLSRSSSSSSFLEVLLAERERERERGGWL